MSTRERVHTTLTQAFDPDQLEVVDESERHRGHAGWREGGGTHLRVRIAARHFAGMSRVAQHRAIMDALETELTDGLHALAIEVGKV